MYDEALRIEDLHLSYRGLVGTAFSKPRALGFFESGVQAGEQELISGANLVIKKGETLYSIAKKRGTSVETIMKPRHCNATL